MLGINLASTVTRILKPQWSCAGLMGIEATLTVISFRFPQWLHPGHSLYARAAAVRCDLAAALCQMMP